MPVLDKLERRFGRFQIPNLCILLVCSQAMGFVFALAGHDISDKLAYVPSLVFQGEVWRLVTFPMVPLSTHWLWGIFALYIFYLFGTSLEGHWGHFKFNVYVLLACISTIILGILTPNGIYGASIINTAIFLAFAYHFPDFEIYIFFILPVKMKYLAMFVWFMLGLGILLGGFAGFITALATSASYFIFFGKDILQNMKTKKRRQERDAQTIRRASQSLHTCATCKATEHTAPHEDFRVCSKCANGEEYCSQHLRDHQHVEAKN